MRKLVSIGLIVKVLENEGLDCFVYALSAFYTYNGYTGRKKLLIGKEKDG